MLPASSRRWKRCNFCKNHGHQVEWSVRPRGSSWWLADVNHRAQKADRIIGKLCGKGKCANSTEGSGRLGCKEFKICGRSIESEENVTVRLPCEIAKTSKRYWRFFFRNYRRTQSHSGPPSIQITFRREWSLDLVRYRIAFHGISCGIGFAFLASQWLFLLPGGCARWTLSLDNLTSGACMRDRLEHFVFFCPIFRVVYFFFLLLTLGGSRRVKH